MKQTHGENVSIQGPFLYIIIPSNKLLKIIYNGQYLPPFKGGTVRQILNTEPLLKLNF